MEEKSNPIVGAIEQNVYKGGFQWKTCKKPTGIKAKELKKIICSIAKNLRIFFIFHKYDKLPHLHIKLLNLFHT